jgi:hypothetical protein
MIHHYHMRLTAQMKLMSWKSVDVSINTGLLCKIWLTNLQIAVRFEKLLLRSIT